MAHIHTEPGQHDTTVSAYVVLEQAGEVPRLWLHRHKKLGCWLQFGGHVELDETPWQAVQHEVIEESGYDMAQLQLLQPQIRIKRLTDAVLHPETVAPNTHSFAAMDNGHSHSDSGYAFVTGQQPAHKVGDDESADMKAMTREEIVAIPKGEIPESAREIAVFILEAIVPAWDRVDPGQFS